MVNTSRFLINRVRENKRANSTLLALFLTLLCSPYAVNSAVYNLPDNNSKLIGQKTNYQVEKGDYFQAISEYHDVGFLALMAANQGVDPFLPVVGSKLIIPKQMLLPYAERKGIVINLAELRLYYFPPEEKIVYVFPVGIGRQGLSTPRVISHIGDKRKDPIWRPTQEMRTRYREKNGKEMAEFIAAGPSNPFGKYALRLGTSEYLIHGSNKRFGIGMRASSGCIRLYDTDIEWLFNNIAVGTQVRIVEQAIKMSYEPNGDKLIEVHQPLSEQGTLHSGELINPAVAKFLGGNENVIKQFEKLITSPSGLVTVLDKDT